MVVLAYNPATQEAEVEDQGPRLAQAKGMRPYPKN
jgi:hypothetical protein